MASEKKEKAIIRKVLDLQSLLKEDQVYPEMTAKAVGAILKECVDLLPRGRTTP